MDKEDFEFLAKFSIEDPGKFLDARTDRLKLLQILGINPYKKPVRKYEKPFYNQLLLMIDWGIILCGLGVCSTFEVLIKPNRYKIEETCSYWGKIRSPVTCGRYWT